MGIIPAIAIATTWILAVRGWKTRNWIIRIINENWRGKAFNNWEA